LSNALQNLINSRAPAQSDWATANARPTLRVESAIARYRREQGPHNGG
jgi:hypothetical protein